jgi:ribosomal protein S27AE
MVKIEEDPSKKSMYQSDMSEYIMQCMPYLKQYMEDDTDKEVTTDNIFNCKETFGLQKRDIFVDYLIDVEKKNLDRPVEKSSDECPKCMTSNIFQFHDTSDLVCETCGTVVGTLINQELTYKEEHETSAKVINYSYKRDNHFNEWLSQFQGQEVTTIPTEVMEQLRNEFKKMKIKSLCEITYSRVRGLLKKLKLNKYYEHVPYITNSLNGVKHPKMPQELEERLRLMFKDIQKPFDDNCPSERKNFLSYSYVLYKFCELLSEDSYLKYFPLLKSKEKLHQQDIIWKKMCHDLQWEFIPTI